MVPVVGVLQAIGHRAQRKLVRHADRGAQHRVQRRIAARIVPQAFDGSGGHGGAGRSIGAALIDDGAPAPAHVRASPARALRVLAVFVAIWLAAMGLLTFGGAYAVLPYVFQGAVEHYQWLTTAQMIGGLALGETTPGPLTMVVAFVGFVGRWSKQVLGPKMLFAGGLLAAAVATYYTFLPSFLFILAGAPFIETTRGQLRFTAPLTGITAAVVGVIVNLAVFFAAHVFWPQGFGGPFDLASAGICAAAFVALWRFKAGVIPVIAACAAAGLALRSVGL